MKYSEELKAKAIEYYLVGYNSQKISEVLGPNEATIRAWLKEKRIPIKVGGSYNTKHSEASINKMIDLYKQGFNTIEITEMLGLKRGVVSYLLRKSGFQLNHRGPKSKIGFEDFFDNIDSSEKAYFLGWIMADGNISISNGQYSLKIHISYEDRELIDNFLESIQSTNKTKVKNGDHISYYVSLTSRHMCESLMKYGVEPRKSGRETFPSDIPNELKKDFIRGVFDGDGITDTKYFRSGFVGGYNLVNSILIEINEPSIKLRNTKSSDVYYFLGGKKFTRKLFSYMYENSTLYLKRKYERMVYICNN